VTAGARSVTVEFVPIRSLVLLGAALALAASAREISIRPDAAGAPVIGPAMEAAEPGSVIRLAPGVYREYVRISKPVTLAGSDGTLIDPSEPLRAKWEGAPAYGKGVYKAVMERTPHTVFIDGKPLAQVNPERKETVAEGPWNWRTLLASGPPRKGFAYIRGLWLYRREERTLYLHLGSDGDPAAHQWSAVFSREAAITVSKADGAAVRGLAAAHAHNGIVVTDGARGTSVVKCRVGAWDKNGILVRSGAAGSLIEDNEVFRDSYESLTPITGSKEWYEVWQIHKIAGLYDRVGICLTLSGAGNRIHRNHVHDTFDGINVGESQYESLDIPLPDNNLDRDTEIWENTVERTGDSGMEIGGPAINIRVHHNVLRRTHGGLRYKLPRIGPVFVYRNVLVDGSPFNIWYSMDDSPAEGYVYHNTIVGGGSAGLVFSSFNASRDIGARRWHYVNNLVVTGRGFFGWWDKKIAPHFTADYNVVQGDGRPYADDRARDSHSRYVKEITVSADFPPLPARGGPAIDAGIDLSTYWNGKPLPGCEPGYFKGKAPDAGAYEIE
jgi:hypothetical protein